MRDAHVHKQFHNVDNDNKVEDVDDDVDDDVPDHVDDHVADDVDDDVQTDDGIRRSM